MSDFVHLHCHSEYSFYESVIRIDGLCERAKELGFTAAAITDYNVMHGVQVFNLASQRVGIKPIFGCEVSVSSTDSCCRASQLPGEPFRLVLLAQNLTGYRNLMRLVTLSYRQGYALSPSVDKQLLAQHSEGLIALSGCLRGEVPRLLGGNGAGSGMDAGLAAAKEYAALFPDRFYLELQSNGLAIQERTNQQLIEVANRLGLPLVVANDCRYLEPADFDTYDVLRGLSPEDSQDAPPFSRPDSRELYYKTPEEMRTSFAHVPEAIANSARIADQCNVALPIARRSFPACATPGGGTADDALAGYCRRGLETRFEKARTILDKDLYHKRLEQELDVIRELGFAPYFLLVGDYAAWARSQSILLGPGGGAAPGFLVAWALGITSIDPVAHGLLFECFIRRDQSSPPDLVLEVCSRGRNEIVKYLACRHGEEKVARVIDFDRRPTNALAREVGQALGVSRESIDAVCDQIPSDDPGRGWFFARALSWEDSKLRGLYASDATISRFIDVARKLEGVPRKVTAHPAGVLICDEPLENYIPLALDSNGERIAQFDEQGINASGLRMLKIQASEPLDLLQGLLDQLRGQGKTPPDLENLDFEDRATYALLERGDTEGVRLLDDETMKHALRTLKPTRFADLIALFALSQSGDLDEVRFKAFVECKQAGGVASLDPILAPLLQETYGLILYQEQIMRIAEAVGGYTLEDADLLRRILGKRNASAMAEHRCRFISGAVQKNMSEKDANRIFDALEDCTVPARIKWYATARASEAYACAYFKTHFHEELSILS